MRVCDCVTQSSLNDIDEEVAHLSGSRERTERRKNMTKKMKVRVSALIMCAAMLVTSMAALAGYSSTTFGDGTSAATASLSTYSWGATAETDPVNLSQTYLSTSIRIVDRYGYANGWFYGESSISAGTAGLTNPMTAYSNHACGSASTSLSCGV